MSIFSNFPQIVSPSTQNAIEKAAACAGAEDVHLTWTNANSDEEPVYDAYDDDDNYLFSIDTDGDVVHQK